MVLFWHKRNDHISLISPTNKVKFDVKKDTLKDCQITKVSVQEAKIIDKKIHQISIWNIGKKRKREMEVIDSVIIRGQKDFDFEKLYQLNLIEVKIDYGIVTNILRNYKRVTYRFASVDLLFTSSVKNDTKEMFLITNSLSETKISLINYSCYKFKTDKKLGKYERHIVLGKREVWRVKNTHKKYHFGFTLTTKNLNDLLSLKFCIWDSENKNIKLIDNEKKLSIMNFKVLEWIIEKSPNKNQKNIIS